MNCLKRIIGITLAAFLIVSSMVVSPLGATQVAAADEKPRQVTFVLHGDTTDRKQEWVETVIKPYLLEKYNIEFNLEWLPWSEYGGGQTELRLASGEDFAGWCNTGIMGQYYSKGYLMDMTDYIYEYGSENFLKMNDEFNMKAFSVGGRCYAIPVGKICNSGEWYDVCVRQDLLEECGMTEITSVEDLEEFYVKCHELHPDYVGWGDGIDVGLHYASCLFYAVSDKNLQWINDGNYAVIDANEEHPVIYSWLESEEFKGISKISQRWQELGILDRDYLIDSAMKNSKFTAGMGMFIEGNSGRPWQMYITMHQFNENAKLKNYNLGGLTDNMLRPNRGSYAVGLYVSAGAKDPGAYVTVIDDIYSSQENYDMWVYGLEGVDYTVNEEGKLLSRVEDGIVFYEWSFDNLNFKRYDATLPDYYINDYNDWDNHSVLRRDIGFVFDSSPVSAQLAQISAVCEEYFVPIIAGLNDYDIYYPEAQQRLKEAGIDDYIAEMQRQWDEFLASK